MILPALNYEGVFTSVILPREYDAEEKLVAFAVNGEGVDNLTKDKRYALLLTPLSGEERRAFKTALDASEGNTTEDVRDWLKENCPK